MKVQREPYLTRARAPYQGGPPDPLPGQAGVPGPGEVAARTGYHHSGPQGCTCGLHNGHVPTWLRGTSVVEMMVFNDEPVARVRWSVL